MKKVYDVFVLNQVRIFLERDGLFRVKDTESGGNGAINKKRVKLSFMTRKILATVFLFKKRHLYINVVTKTEVANSSKTN